MHKLAGKHVAIFSAQYFPHVGGVENYTFHVAREMARAGIAATVVTLGDSKGISREEASDGFTVLRLPARQLLHGRYPIARPFDLPRRILANDPVNYVVVNTRFYPHSLSAVAFAQDRGIIPVVIEHGSAHLTLGNAVFDCGVAAIEHFMTALVKRHPAQYYGVSKRSSEWLSHFGIASSGELYNSIDADAFAQSASSRDYRSELGVAPSVPLVAFVGRLAPEKGVQQLLAAASTLPEVHFVLAGDGPLRSQLEAEAGRNVSLVGSVSSADVASLLSQADLFCLPSHSEGFATSLLEAAACATPAVITDVGGARELIGDKGLGFVIDSMDDCLVKQAIVTALADREELEAMGVRVRNRVKDMFSWKKTAERVLEACERANAHSTTS